MDDVVVVVVVVVVDVNDIDEKDDNNDFVVMDETFKSSKKKITRIITNIRIVYFRGRNR
jgi:hypothetical protein